MDHRPHLPERGEAGIGVVGAGFIVRDCRLVAYAEAGFHVVGITSRTVATAREVAALRGVPTVHRSVEEMLHDPIIDVMDVALPPAEQAAVIHRVLASGGGGSGCAGWRSSGRRWPSADAPNARSARPMSSNRPARRLSGG